LGGHFPVEALVRKQVKYRLIIWILVEIMLKKDPILPKYGFYVALPQFFTRGSSAVLNTSFEDNRLM